MHVDEISGLILEAAIEVHRELGPGLLEKVYEVVLAHQLVARGLRVQRQQRVKIKLYGTVFPEAFRIDLLVQDIVVVEIKSTARHDPVFERQVLTYLRLMGLPVGLVLNFGCQTLLAGAKRVVNNAPAHAGSRVHLNTLQEPKNSTGRTDSRCPTPRPPRSPREQS
jgi:GxxExxY protein